MRDIIKLLKPCRIENRILLLIALYNLAIFLSNHIPVAICNTIRLILGISFIVIILKKCRYTPIKGLTGVLYSILVLWTLILTLRLFFEDIESFKGVTLNNKLGQLLFSDNFLPYLLPLILLCFNNNYKIDVFYFNELSKKIAILFIIFLPIAILSMLTFNVDMDAVRTDENSYAQFVHTRLGLLSILPAFILIYFKKYLKNKEWWIYMIAFLGALFIGLYMARRGRSAIYALYLISCWMLYLYNKKGKSKIKFFLGGIIIVLLCLVIFSNTQDSLFSLLVERGLSDSRTGIEENMTADMKGWDWIIGRGFFGTYYDPSFGYNRSDIETGYLALILKGGIIYLFCFVGVLLTSAYNGLFKSNNLFIKSFAIILIISVIDLYPFGWPKFNFHYFTVWLGVYMCNKESYRKLTDTEISNIFFNNSKIA